MFFVKKMSVEDLDFAVQLTDTRDWGLTVEDFQFNIELEPNGCFTLFDDNERIGIITSISYGRIGWFGNLIVEEKHRRKGAASILVKQVLNYLISKGAETVGLYSYMDSIGFYEKLGFKPDSQFTVLEGKAFESQVQQSINRAKEDDLQKIIVYDNSCLNMSRKKLLEAIFYKVGKLCYFYEEEGQICGYVMAKVYDGLAELGPLICNRERSNIVTNLIRAVLQDVEGFHVSMYVPKKEAKIIDFLKENGMHERFDVVRMFFKPTSIKDCVYIAESLERG